jgi:hypothetical protein
MLGMAAPSTFAAERTLRTEELCSTLYREQASVAAVLDFPAGGSPHRAPSVELRLEAESTLVSLEAEWKQTAEWIDRARRALTSEVSTDEPRPIRMASFGELVPTRRGQAVQDATWRGFATEVRRASPE